MTPQNISEEPGKTGREKKRNIRNTRKKTVTKKSKFYTP